MQRRACIALLACAPAAHAISLRWLTGYTSGGHLPGESLLFGSAAEADRVTRLPGQPKGVPESSLYSGYIAVDDARSLFFTLQTSAISPLTDPLVMWLNGGPGCSSLGGGWLGELGPYFPKADGTLKANPFAWTRAGANVLFVESPAGVGFSYSNKTSDYRVGDARTAADLRIFLIRFLQRYSGLAHADLYITGESYAGHYVPTLAAAILDAYDALSANLKGIAIGNAWTDAGLDNLGAIQHWYSHYLISTAAYTRIVAACNFSTAGPVLAVDGNAIMTEAVQTSRRLATTSSSDGGGELCGEATDAAFAEMGPLDIYDTFKDLCPSSQAATLLQQMGEAAANGVHILHSALRALHGSSESDGSGFPAQDSCIDDHIAAYLNRADVRAALHVAPFIGEWSMCTNKLSYSSADVITSMLPVYRRLIASPLRIMLYSGDVDGIVPTSGSRLWIESLNLPVAVPWRAWNTTGDGHLGTQTAGYVTQYDTPGLQGGFTFATVRGAGHMVPTTQPGRALAMFDRFLHDTPL